MGAMELEYRFVDRCVEAAVRDACLLRSTKRRRRGRTKLAAFKVVFEGSV